MDILKKSIDAIKKLGVKELTPSESIEMMKNLIKKSKVNIQDVLTPGSLVSFIYNAKDQTEIYDRTPFVMVLSKTSKYMLGANFHWMPVNRRAVMVDYILRKNSKEIRNKRPLKMKYRDIRNALKNIGAFPIIRLYIRARMSSQGIKVPDELLMEAAKMRTETFTGGKVNSTTLWSRAKLRAQGLKNKIIGR